MSKLDDVFNQYTSTQKTNVKSARSEYESIILDDDTQDIDTNTTNKQVIPQYVDKGVQQQKFVAPERRSYFVAGNVNNNEINTTAQRPNEIEYEANVVGDEKKKDDYFGLTKLATNKKDIVKNAIKYIVQAPNLIQNAANTVGMITGKSGEDVIKEGVRGFAGSTVDFASSLYRFFKQNTNIAKTYTKEQLDKVANLGNIVAGGESFANNIAQKYTQFYKQIDEQNKNLRDKTEKFLQYTGIAKTDKDGFIYDLVGGGASLVYAIGIAAITKSPAAAAEMFGAYQYQSLYEEGIDKGFSAIKARSIGLIGGAFEGGLELVGLHVLIDTLKARRSFAKILKAAATEFTQEASQQGAEELLAKVSELREDSTTGKILSNVLYAGIIGAILGGGSATVSNVFYKQISDSATKELISNGVDNDYAKEMVNNILALSVSPQAAQEVVNIVKDEQSPVTYKNADPRETYKETGEAIKKALDPQQQRGVELEFIEANKQLTQELADVLLSSGKAKTADEAYRQAEAGVAMYDSLAREAYNQENIRPAEYYKRFHVNAQSGQIELDERNIDEDNTVMDDSFEPINFDENERAKYEAEIEGYEDWLADEQKRSGIKNNFETQKNILADIGIGKIRKPQKNDARYAEYQGLSARIKNAFFTDVETAMTWDEAEQILQQHNGDSADIFEYFEDIDRTVPVGQDTYLQVAYHGGQVDFDKFSTQYIGEGEGIQAHGWGLYFAQNKNTSEDYRKHLSTTDVFLNGKKITPLEKIKFSRFFDDGITNDITKAKNKIKKAVESKQQDVDYYNERIDLLQEGLSVVEKNKNKSIKEIIGLIPQGIYILSQDELDARIKRNAITVADIIGNIKNDIEKNEMELQYDEEELKLLKSFLDGEIKIKQGQLFKVDIPEEDVLLDEQKTFQEQPKKVQEAIRKMCNEEGIDFDKLLKANNKFFSDKNNTTGKVIYNNLVDYCATKLKPTDYGDDATKNASLLLNKYGIKGITYDGQQDGRAYVIFDDKAVKVLEKFYQSRPQQQINKKFNNILNVTAQELIDIKSDDELEYKLQQMFGDYKDVDVFAETKMDSADELLYMLSLKYMADLEYAVKENSYTDVQGLLDDLKKDVVEILKLKDYNNVNETSKEKDNLPNTTGSSVLRTEESAERNLYSNAAQTDLQVKNLSIKQLRNINDNIVLHLFSNDNYNVPFTKKTVQFLKSNNIKKVDESGIFVEGKEQEDYDMLTLQTDKKFYSVEEIEQVIEGYQNLGYKKETEYYQSLLNDFLKLQNDLMAVQDKLRVYIAKDVNKRSLFERFYQEQQQARGATTVVDRQYYIDLFSNSDKSTLLHELSHGYLSEVLYFANGKNPSKKILDIKKQLDDWLGVPENNGKYSTEQQEKFAQSAEVYFMEGKAPTAKLKTVFERFKKWLSQIYDAIRDELPKINDDVRVLFDNILSRSYDVPDSNIYAGKEKAIKEVIKNIQEGRASEVDGITVDDVYNLLNMAYMRKPSRPSKNLKQLLNDKNIYDFNELSKVGQDNVLTILKDGGYVKADSTAEDAVELAKQALDGKPVYRLADQWRVAGDIDFARNLRVLEKVIEFSQIDSTIEKILNLQQEGYRNVEQQDVEQVKSEYRRLMDSEDVKEAKKVVEDIINRLHKKSFIDRNAQKQMINDLKYSATIEEIRESVLDVIEDLQDEIKLVKEQLRNPRKPVVRKDKTIPPSKDATEEEKNTYKKYMRKQINRLLKQALPRKQNQQKFSKFDEQTQRFFTDLQKYNKMTIEQAQEELYARATNIIDDEGVGLDNFEKIKNMFLSYKANKVNQNTTEFYKQLYDNLQDINVFGRNAKEIQETLRKEQIQKDINSLVENIENNRSKNVVSAGVKKQYIKWLGNWWSTINAIAGKKQADKDSLERIEINIFNKNYSVTENLKTKCAAALGLKNATDLDMTVNRYLNKEFTYNELDSRSNTENAVKLNKMQLICCYIWMKNSNLRERIVRAYGNEQIMNMMSQLTVQDKLFGDELQKAVADLYDDVNAVYLKMYGLDMPQAENYFPSSTERIQGNMDLLKDNIGQVTSPGFIKARVESNLPLMNFGNPVKMALDHIAKVNHFIYMQEKLADLNKVYKTTIVKRHITNAYSDRVYKYILQVLDNAKFSTVARTIDGISDVGDYLVNNYVLTKIAIKPSIMIKQLLSCINYAENMSAVQWFGGFLKAVSNPFKYREVVDFMMTNSKYCQSRFAKGGQTEALLKAMEGSKELFARVKTFKGFLSWTTRVGDIGAIIFGGYPYVMDQMSKGVSLEKAIENFEEATIRSQQASLPSTLSNFQYRGMDSWLYRAMFAFANTPNQYSRKIGDSMYMYFHGDIDKKQLGKNLMIYACLNSLLYTSFTSLAILAGLVSGDWDDFKDDVIMSLMQTSNVLALPIVSQAYNSFVSRVVTGSFTPDKEIPLLDDMIKIMKTATKEKIEFKDYLTIVDEVVSLVAGVPVKTLYNGFVGSTKDLLDGEYGKFAVKLYGATESRANKIFD